MLDSGRRTRRCLSPARARDRSGLRSRPGRVDALDYDPEFWTDLIDGALEKADNSKTRRDPQPRARGPHPAHEAPDDPRLEDVLKLILGRISRSRARTSSTRPCCPARSAGTSSRRTTAAAPTRHRITARRSPRSARSASNGCSGSRRDRGAKFFDSAIKTTASNGAAPMKSWSAFTLLRQVQGDDRGEWSQLLDIADSVVDRLTGEDKLYVAIQPDTSRSTSSMTSRVRGSSSRSQRASSPRTRTCRTSCRPSASTRSARRFDAGMQAAPAAAPVEEPRSSRQRRRPRQRRSQGGNVDADDEAERRRPRRRRRRRRRRRPRRTRRRRPTTRLRLRRPREG